MAKKKLSARAARRAGDRETVKLAQDLERLWKLGPGGTPERPIVLASASQVEVTARGTRCPLCQGELRVEEHAAETVAGSRLRVAHVRCVACGSRRAIWFRLATEMLN
ncbi:hypothetical protein [Chondromyces apiculatus]|uniref:Uncharacterized protein n=1 Tax=Chondromyces apiculatus DSM 436 TaxID=1192034 RepID=A0A017TCK1_9BACT|nr:hypothetical protein [Chondromyces apiculatus]EYF06627.1 Hypothetical protein CAP_1757 [Chondromyces apiculatus DSM 436]